MFRSFIVATACGLSMTVAAVSTAQQRQSHGSQTFAAGVDLVTLHVAVTDRHGAMVDRLRADDFLVYDEGQPQTLQFFGVDDTPATVGFVIDCSGSMRERRAAVTAAASAFAAHHHPRDELFTVNFNEYVWRGLPREIVFAENADQLRLAVAGAPTVGMTALYDAVHRALDLLPLGSRERKALIIVSDGGDNASTSSLAAALEHARRSEVAIYTVSLARDDDREARPQVLEKLARETGGAAFAAKDAADMAQAFVSIARELRGAYTIGYVAPEAAEAGYRSVRVIASTRDRERLTVRTRIGYYAERSARPAQQP